MNQSKSISIYTDGGCTGNPGPGAWAAILLSPGEDPVELSGSERSTTNNRMELIAVIHGLSTLCERWGTTRKIILYTDSQYVQKGISQWIQAWERKGWKKASGSPVKNKDLWIRLRELDKKLSISWEWVKGHAGDRWNERCDTLVSIQRSLF